MNAYTTGGPDLIWYGAGETRRKPVISAFGILDTFVGVLVRDDYGGYTSYDEQLAGVQQCLAHLYRYLGSAEAIDPAIQVWARSVGQILREGATAVKTARMQGRDRLDEKLLADLRHRYDQAVAVGISTNLSQS